MKNNLELFPPLTGDSIDTGPRFAFEAELDFDEGRPVYDVEALNTSGAAFEVQIDGLTGAVLGVTEADD